MSVHQSGGWDVEALDDAGPAVLTRGLTNPYTLDAFPDLKVFPG